MRYLTWRETLSMLVFWICSFLVLAYVILLVIDPNIQIHPMIGLSLLAIAALIIMRKLSLSFPEFLSILKKNGFVMAQEKSSEFIGMTKDDILIKGFFFGRYILVNEDVLSKAATSSNIRFYFPCSTPGLFNHYIMKFGTNFKFDLNRIRRENIFLTISESELHRIFFNICSDIEFLAINRLASGTGFICIETGPKSLLYGKYSEKNIIGILKFIRAYKKQFGCQEVKWNMDISLNTLSDHIRTIENSCI